jgi:hypothetical protein
MLTPEAATNAGLPVYIACRSCHAPSRAARSCFRSNAGKGDLDLETAAKLGARVYGRRAAQAPVRREP